MNQYQFSVFIIPTILAGFLSILAVSILWSHSSSRGSKSLIYIFIAIAIWSFGYSLELIVPSLPWKAIWLKFEYLGIVWISVFWLLFCLQFSNAYIPKTKNFLLIFSWLPLITLALAFTNEYHHLIWDNLTIVTQYGIYVFKMTYGAWFWVHIFYSALLYLIGLYFLIQYYFKTPRNMRIMVSLVILAGFIPAIASIIYQIENNPLPLIDLTSISFVFSGLIIVYGLYFRQILDIVPIARDTTIENMRDGIIVVDLQDRIVDMNPAAEAIIQAQFDDVLGKPAKEVLTNLVDWISLSKGEKTPVKVINIGEGRNKKFYVLNQIPLTDFQGTLVGYTIIFHDNTESHHLHKDLKDQADRLAVLYEIGKAITSTLKIDDLLELIYVQLSKVITSDAYFVALYVPETHELDVRIMYDKGKQYTIGKVNADEGLSSWVVKNKQPLLIFDLRKELRDLPVKPILIGDKQISRSWLGVPLLAENELIGLLAVASYVPNSFDESDKRLMEQIGQQAVLSIQNARHYEEVTRQAKLDSLTGVSNHNNFIEILYQEGDLAKANRSPLSLIMLDIDYFKLYNDTYGHTIGDQVLKLTVQAVQSHIKNTDTVGRWGGEEFGIVLPNATARQANMVANRIRRTLSELPLFNVEGKTIPKPTISQGIGTIPDHTSDVGKLVIIADQALYRAKDRGRDQVAVGKPSLS